MRSAMRGIRVIESEIAIKPKRRESLRGVGAGLCVALAARTKPK